MRGSILSRFLGISLLVVTLTCPAVAQSGGGTITGSVTDASGADAPRVEVIATNQDTGV